MRSEAAKTMASRAELQFKHVRHSGMTRYADAGCETAQISAISGHEIGTFNPDEMMLGAYIAKTRDQTMSGIRRRIADEFGRSGVVDEPLKPLS